MTRSWFNDDSRFTDIDASRSRGDEAGVIDGEGRTIVPGLIDCHVHLSSSRGMLHDLVLRSSRSHQPGYYELRAGLTSHA